MSWNHLPANRLASVAELVYAPALEAGVLRHMRVRIPPLAQTWWGRHGVAAGSSSYRPGVRIPPCSTIRP